MLGIISNYLSFGDTIVRGQSHALKVKVNVKFEQNKSNFNERNEELRLYNTFNIGFSNEIGQEIIYMYLNTK